MSVRFIYLLAILALLGGSIAAHAQSVDKSSASSASQGADGESTEGQTPVLTSSPDVDVALVFHQIENNKIEAGQVVEVLVGFHNKGKQSFNVTNVQASFMHPEDLNIFIHNFTGFTYSRIVQPGEIASLAYMFLPDTNLDAQDIGLLLSTWYHDETGRYYMSSPFNSTVELVEPESNFDVQVFFGTAIIAVIAAIGIYVYFQSSSKPTLRVSEYSRRHADNEDDWLSGTSAAFLSKRGGNGGKKSASKRK